MDERTTLHMQLLDLKNEISNTKLIISSIKLDIEITHNKEKATKLKNKQFFLLRRLRSLSSQKAKLEKQYSIICKGERMETW